MTFQRWEKGEAAARLVTLMTSCPDCREPFAAMKLRVVRSGSDAAMVSEELGKELAAKVEAHACAAEAGRHP